MRPVDFWSHVDMRGADDCWLWTGYVNPATGYGQSSLTRNGHRHRGAHVIAYVLTHDEVPPGREIDHLCETLLCCNPAHLEAVSHSENILRWWRGHDLVAS